MHVNRTFFRRVTRIKNYVTITIPDYSERQFREHFRMSRTTFENLERMLALDLIRTTESGRFTLDVRTQLLAVLWLLATPDSFRSVSDRFDISKSLLHDSMKRVVVALNNLADRFIKWPTGDQLNKVKQRFSEIGYLPDVIGAIDGCHIPIPAPKVSSVTYKQGWVS
ncbi:Putative nuclease HARBI1 [Cyphomyrmex costatus]|uniref:Putative nuclease HARBI1 n=1 Tax=Cyphomyrmex costatus TaxID=456900 RepID=A0A151IPQ5_9HYME|nr:Putative nuclease HARBI1 [Cyphomyrmex costatus]